MPNQPLLAQPASVRIVAEDPFEQLLDRYLAGWAERERALEGAQSCRLPPETVQEFRASGVLAAPIPRALGGAGADLQMATRALQRVARVAPSTALCLAMPLGNAANTRLPDDAVAPTLRLALARGRAWIAHKVSAGAILAVANSEPGAGGDLANTRTKVLLDGDGTLRISGEKSFATLGPDADYFLCAARLADGTLDAFFVASSAPGVTVREDFRALGLRPTASVGLSLKDAPAEAVFVYPGAIGSVNARHWSTLLLASVLVGIGEGALEAATACAPRSSSWVRATLADCALALDAASGFVQAVAQSDQIPCTERVAERFRRAKTFAARAAWDTATRVMSVSGGQAYRPGHAVARYLLDAAAGPLLRPPLAAAMDSIASELCD